MNNELYVKFELKERKCWYFSYRVLVHSDLFWNRRLVRTRLNSGGFFIRVRRTCIGKRRKKRRRANQKHLPCLLLLLARKITNNRAVGIFFYSPCSFSTRNERVGAVLSFRPHFGKKPALVRLLKDLLRRAKIDHRGRYKKEYQPDGTAHVSWVRASHSN
jgi:hypothetical protein